MKHLRPFVLFSSICLISPSFGQSSAADTSSTATAYKQALQFAANAKTQKALLKAIAEGDKVAAIQAIQATEIDTTDPVQVAEVVEILFELVTNKVSPEQYEAVVENASLAIGAAVAELTISEDTTEAQVAAVLGTGARAAVKVSASNAPREAIKPPAVQKGAVGFLKGAMEVVEKSAVGIDAEAVAESVATTAVSAASDAGVTFTPAAVDALINVVDTLTPAEPATDTDADTDTDTDTDSDSDTDAGDTDGADTDSDTDTDADADSDTGTDTSTDTGAGDADAGAGDTGGADTGAGDTGGTDTGAGDTGAGDSGGADTGGGDTGGGDSGGGIWIDPDIGVVSRENNR